MTDHPALHARVTTTSKADSKVDSRPKPARPDGCLFVLVALLVLSIVGGSFVVLVEAFGVRSAVVVTAAGVLSTAVVVTAWAIVAHLVLSWLRDDED